MLLQIKQTQLFLLLSLCQLVSISQDLKVIDQDYQRALQIASVENKLIFVDFYTTWCIPCKQLDKLVFQNDSVRQQLGSNFVLLKYDAEKDSIFHLSKKHHVSSYPTGLILDRNGFVIERKYGFRGDDAPALTNSVFEFTNKGLAAAGVNKKLKGYSNKIDASRYPRFYVDYINRTNTDIDTAAVKKYWSKLKNLYKEEHFSIALYFGGLQLPGSVTEDLVKNRTMYEDLYGKTDVEVLLYFISAGKFDQAIAENNESKFDSAVEYMRSTLGEEYITTVLPSFQKEFLIRQNKWDEVFLINEELKKSGKFSNDAINNFCWTVYKKCNDQQVIARCTKWMKELTTLKPDFSYLDTYSFLLYKSGDKEEARKIIPLAIAAAKQENENPKKLEELLKKL